MITFTIDGKQYQAEEGVIWRVWCNSSYNTDGFLAQGVEPYGSITPNSDVPLALYIDNKLVRIGDAIIENGVYYFDMY